MLKVQEILKTNEEFTLDEFWDAVNSFPDLGESKKHKDNINAYFKKDGTPKALSPQSQEDYQSIYDTEVFIHTVIGKLIQINKVKYHVDVHKQHIKDIREGKSRKMKVVKYGKLEEFKKIRGENNEEE